jgi:hypothetical protein
MRSFFRSVLALFALGTATGCNPSADPSTAAERPRGTAGGLEVTLLVPGMT